MPIFDAHLGLIRDRRRAAASRGWRPVRRCHTMNMEAGESHASAQSHRNLLVAATVVAFSAGHADAQEFPARLNGFEDRGAQNNE